MQGSNLRIIGFLCMFLCAFSLSLDRLREAIGRSLRPSSGFSDRKLNTHLVTSPRKIGILARMMATLFSM
jgi:hypothetical protein